MKTKFEIILETAAFYNSTNRAMMQNMDCDKPRCVYLTRDGKKCAVGRCTRDGAEIRISFLNVADWIDDGGSLENQLLPEYRGHDVAFWLGVQRLHDEAENWTETGLSCEGEKTVFRMLEYYRS